jgi:hypothetical protein
MACRFVCGVLALLALPPPAVAQQRPLITQDPEPVGGGRVLVEGSVDYAFDQHYPASGLEGNLWRIPTLGVCVGLSSIVELQVKGGPYDHLDVTSRNQGAPLASLVTSDGTTTHDVEDITVATKIRLLSETMTRPAIGVLFASRLPIASNASGLGLGTTDFSLSLLGAKTVQSIRVVGNIGLGILSDPTMGNRQNDVVTYGMSFARAMTQETELVGEINGRVSTQGGTAFPGTETRGILKLGGRYTRGPARLDAGVLLGLTATDPTFGFTAGVTYVFEAFTVP